MARCPKILELISWVHPWVCFQAPLATQVEQSIQRSLQNLGTSYLDSLVMHSPMPTLEENLEVRGICFLAELLGAASEITICHGTVPKAKHCLSHAEVGLRFSKLRMSFLISPADRECLSVQVWGVFERVQCSVSLTTPLTCEHQHYTIRTCLITVEHD